MPHFRHITRHFTLRCPVHDHTPACQWGKALPVDGIEWIGTGLAIQHVFHRLRLEEPYGLLPIASGRRLTADSMPTLAEAALWLRNLKDSTDWTQPAAHLQGRGGLRNRIDAARKQALHQYTEMIEDQHEGRIKYVQQ